MKNIVVNQSKYTFSICTLVTNFIEYEEMVNSFKKAGFSDGNSEFNYIDNSNGNSEDAYSGLNKFLNLSNGEYIIICHQDVLLKYDNVEILQKCLQELDALDPDWAIVGNAGFNNFTEAYYRISDPHGENTKTGKLPSRVKSLDENFLVVKNEANLTLSHNLKGFHLYATDLVTIAYILGWNAYVVNFHLYHKSSGNDETESFASSKQAFIEKYAKVQSILLIRTVCTSMIITGNIFLNRLLNRERFYRMRRRFENVLASFK